MIGQAFFFTLLCNSFFFPSDPFDSLSLSLSLPFATYDSRLPSPLSSFHPLPSQKQEMEKEDSWILMQWRERKREMTAATKRMSVRRGWRGKEKGQKERDCVSVCVCIWVLFIWFSCGRKEWSVSLRISFRFPFTFSLTYGEHFVNLSHGKRDREKRSWDQKESGTGYS